MAWEISHAFSQNRLRKDGDRVVVKLPNRKCTQAWFSTHRYSCTLSYLYQAALMNEIYDKLTFKILPSQTIAEMKN